MYSFFVPLGSMFIVQKSTTLSDVNVFLCFFPAFISLLKKEETLYSQVTVADASLCLEEGLPLVVGQAVMLVPLAVFFV